MSQHSGSPSPALTWKWKNVATRLRIASMLVIAFFGVILVTLLSDLFRSREGDPDSGDVWMILMGLPMALSLFAAGCAGWHISRPNPRRICRIFQDVERPSLLVRLRRSSVAARVLLTLCAAWMLASAPWLTDFLDDPSGHARGAFISLLAQTFGPVIAIPFVVYGALSILHWKSAGLEIDRNGICVLSPLGRLAYDWDSIAGFYPNRGLGNRISIAVQDSRKHGAADPRENFLTRTEWIRTRYSRSLQTVHLQCEPAVTYQALQYYLRHADKREELGTEAGLERIRQGRFEDINKEINLHGDIIR